MGKHGRQHLPALNNLFSTHILVQVDVDVPVPLMGPAPGPPMDMPAKDQPRVTVRFIPFSVALPVVYESVTEVPAIAQV
jgi:hypothetical protein